MLHIAPADTLSLVILCVCYTVRQKFSLVLCSAVPCSKKIEI